ncbi:P-loop containing nucleoside triphosphate hydrolase protein [Ceratobasidium sp. AG-I]|nr:P-loop containing nucleoside triphosphate hydrolase protein [Ceratobasidium sp. AG-I]
MARKGVASPTKAPRKSRLKKSTLSSDSLFGFPSPSASNGRQLSVPRFNLSQNSPAGPQVIDLTSDDESSSRSLSVPPVPVPVAKRARRTSPSPLGPAPTPSAAPRQPKTDLEGEDKYGEALWVDAHAPETRDQLAVHARKVEDVRRWLDEAIEGGPTGKLRRYRRILVLTGPSGSGKTATLRVLASELDAELVEWVASSDEFSTTGDYNYESAMTKLVNFLDRAGSYTSLSLSNAASSKSKSDSSPPTSKHKHKILVLEDFPSLSHPRVRSTLHTTLVRFAESSPPLASASLDPSSSTSPTQSHPPLVIILSDAGLRADDSMNYSNSREDVLDVRSVLPAALVNSVYVTQIKFNPIAATFMRKALSSIISSHLSLSAPGSSTKSKSKTGNAVPREILDALVEASAGDIRSAIMGVQFACTVGQGQSETNGATGKTKGKGRGKKAEKDASVKAMFAAVTRREQALALFHLLGRVFYNKRYGDPEEETEPPPGLAKAPPLPEHLGMFERRVSKVDIDALHADSPVDASLFTLYVQQNYTQFCDDVDECMGLAEALSEADGGMGVLDDGPTTSSALARHTFQHIARSALLSLPSPVPRRSQVMRKPAWFAARAKERDAEGAVEDARRWLGAGWDRRSVVLDGGLLGSRGPPSLQSFSTLRWDSNMNANGDALGEEESVGGGVDLDADDVDALERRAARVGKPKEEVVEKGYLSDDDIGDF